MGGSINHTRLRWICAVSSFACTSACRDLSKDGSVARYTDRESDRECRERDDSADTVLPGELLRMCTRNVNVRFWLALGKVVVNVG